MIKVTTYSNPCGAIDSVTIEGIKPNGKPIFKAWNNPNSVNAYINATWIDKAREQCLMIADEYDESIAWVYTIE